MKYITLIFRAVFYFTVMWIVLEKIFHPMFKLEFSTWSLLLCLLPYVILKSITQFSNWWRKTPS